MYSIQQRSDPKWLRASFISLMMALLAMVAATTRDAGAAQSADSIGGVETGTDATLDSSDGAITVADHDSYKRKKYKRKKYKHRKRKKIKHRHVELVDPYPGHLPPLHLADSHCSSDLIGTLLGGAAGGLVGSQIGDGTGQMAAVGAGVFLGAILGNNIGASVDAHDRNCMARTLGQVPDNQQVVWQNPNTGQDYAVTPTRSYDARDGRYCREYTAESIVGGQVQQTYGTACWQPDGSWQIVN